MQVANRQHVIGSIGVSLVCIALLCIALFTSPPYAFYGAMKWAIAIGGGYCAWSLFEAKPSYAPLALVLIILAAIHFLARMRRADWVVFNLAGLVTFLVVALCFAIEAKKSRPAESGK